MDAPEFHVTVKLANNRLRRLRVAAGLTARQLAEKIGIGYNTYVAIENLHQSPLCVDGWRAIALKIADHWGELPEDLWPEIVRAVKCPVRVAEMDAHRLELVAAGEAERLALPAPDEAATARELQERIAAQLATLRPREARIIRARFGLDDGEERTLEDIGAEEGVTRDRIRQIEAKALRKLRHPERSNNLRPYAEGE